MLHEDPIDPDDLPFLLKSRTDEEIAEYDEGFAVGEAGHPVDDIKSFAWQRGWAEAQE